MKKALAIILTIICGAALNLLVVASFWPLYYEMRVAGYVVAALIALTAALGLDCLRCLFRKKLNLKSPVFLVCAYVPSIIAAFVYRSFQADPTSELDSLSLLIGACIFAVCGLAWLAVSAWGEKAKPVRAVFAILMCGFAANYLIWLGAGYVGLMTNLSLIFLIVTILLIIAAAALLNLVRNKCKNKLNIHGAAVVLCAQLPWIVYSLVGFVRSRIYANSIPEGTLRHIGAGIDEVMAGIGIATGLLIPAAVFVIADDARHRERR